VWLRIAVPLAFALAVAAGPAAAQARADASRLDELTAAGVLPEFPGVAMPLTTSPGATFLASAFVPGAGQYLLGADRWVPYIAVELWGWISYFRRRGEARDLERRYRDLAWSVARRISVGPRRDSIFEYYEDMGRFSASGTFDAEPGLDGLQPELDRTTYNGDLWLLSRALFIPGGRSLPPEHPDYQLALAYYQENAVPPSFAWAWGDSDLERQVFAGVIRESDDAFRDSTRLLGIILANHVVSAVDALVLARLRAEGGERRLRFRLGTSIEPDPGGLRWTPSLHIAF
jgi:hypothetical protein